MKSHASVKARALDPGLVDQIADHRVHVVAPRFDDRLPGGQLVTVDAGIRERRLDRVVAYVP